MATKKTKAIGKGKKVVAANRSRASAAGKKPAAAKRTAPKKSARTVRKKPESLRLRTASVGLTVNDLPRSIAWYCDVLGFTQGERFERNGELHGIQLRAGEVDLYLSQDDWKKGRDRQKGQGIRIYLTTAQSVDMIARRAKEKGAPLDEEPWDTPWKTRTFAITDPDGFKISIESGE
jgi:uncharacterized glyoxalase superfamily protein PhnB